MFGVGENPVYLERQQRRDERRRASGAAQRQEEDARREALIMGSLYGPTPEAGGEAGTDELEERAPPLSSRDGDAAVARELPFADDAAAMPGLDALFSAPARLPDGGPSEE